MQAQLPLKLVLPGMKGSFVARGKLSKPIVTERAGGGQVLITRYI